MRQPYTKRSDAIVLVHFGKSSYLNSVLVQLRRFNPESRIVLLGDRESLLQADHLVECYLAEDFGSGARRFREAYVHLSSHDHLFEENCLARWLYLSEFCRNQGIETVFYFDSDVVVFEAVRATEERLIRVVGDFDVALSGVRSEFSVCGHASIWRRLDLLNKFCDFILKTYLLENAAVFLRLVSHSRKAGDHVSALDAGLVSDMTLFTLFIEQCGSKIADTSLIREGVTADHNINIGRQGGEHFALDGTRKALIWMDGLPHGQIDDGSYIRFSSLHCQGEAKKLIAFIAGHPNYDDGDSMIEPKLPRDFIAVTYRLLLGREPDEAGIAFYETGFDAHLEPWDFLEELVKSEEFGSSSLLSDERRDEMRVFIVSLVGMIKRERRTQEGGAPPVDGAEPIDELPGEDPSAEESTI